MGLDRFRFELYSFNLLTWYLTQSFWTLVFSSIKWDTNTYLIGWFGGPNELMAGRWPSRHKITRELHLHSNQLKSARPWFSPKEQREQKNQVVREVFHKGMDTTLLRPWQQWQSSHNPHSLQENDGLLSQYLREFGKLLDGQVMQCDPTSWAFFF